MNNEDLVVKATLTLRLVRSFEHRNIKHVVLRDVDLTWNSSRFMEHVNSCKFFSEYPWVRANTEKTHFFEERRLSSPLI